MSTPTSEKGCYYNHVNASAENTLSELKNPAVRDLAWACFSAPLFDSNLLTAEPLAGNCHFPLTTERWLWLQQLDQKPARLQQALANAKSTRLGLYFERLWQFFLQQDRQVDLLAHNLPVRSGGSTLGEFDLIYFCHRRQRHVHLELAIKFYLCAPGVDGRQWQHWLGPNSRDRLNLKIQRLMEHQIRLADQAAAGPALAQLGVEQPLREIEIKGRLYWHSDSNAVHPPAYNRQLARHRWLRASDAAPLLEATPHQPLARAQWLAPLVPSAVTLSSDPAPVTDKARQYALLNPEGQEQQRLFVVPDNWPQTHE